jgi:HAD superfamily hydrolase (TIGR01509 family)
MKTILVDAVNTFVVDRAIYQPLLNLLEEYPNGKIILTNANDEQMKQFGLTDLPYELFTLRHTPDKVDPKYFNQMLDHFKLQPQDVIYFEHNPEAVKSAQSIGITTYHYDPEKKDLETLRSFLNENLS